MQQRCHNPRNSSWRYYGARGIAVWSGWRGPGAFARFLAHVGPRPSAAHSIDRIDNARGYEPGNVQWATAAEQSQNRRLVAMVAKERVRAFGRMWSDDDNRELMRLVRDDLESAFGAVVTPSPRPGDLTVEEFYWAGDYGPGNYHTDGLDNGVMMIHLRKKAA